MKQRTKYFGAGLALVFILGGCGSTVQGFQQPPISPPPSLANVSGQYQGTASGKFPGAATANLAQTGSAVGGTLTLPTSGGVLTVALALASNSTLSGTATNLNAQACTFSVSATYNAANAAHPQLSGSYSSEHGCGGQNGNFVLKQICVYRNAEQSPDALRRRNTRLHPDSGLHPC